MSAGAHIRPNTSYPKFENCVGVKSFDSAYKRADAIALAISLVLITLSFRKKKFVDEGEGLIIPVLYCYSQHHNFSKYFFFRIEALFVHCD